MTQLSNPLTEPIGAERPDYAKVGKRERPRNTNRAFKTDPTALAQLQEDLCYDEGSGRVVWARNPARGRRMAGMPAGHENSTRGYRMVKYKHALLMESHVVWALVHGEWPKGIVRHRDGDLSNTKIDNLTTVNDHINPSGMPMGVKQQTNGKFKVFIWRKRDHYLGTYATVEEAAAVYRRACELVHNRNNWAVEPEVLLQGIMMDYKNRAKPGHAGGVAESPQEAL